MASGEAGLGSFRSGQGLTLLASILVARSDDPISAYRPATQRPGVFGPKGSLGAQNVGGTPVADVPDIFSHPAATAAELSAPIRAISGLFSW